jgi:hypothetical protein
METDSGAVAVCRARVADILRAAGFPLPDVARLARRWVVCADYLEHEFTRSFCFVIGNSPYVRQEAIPAAQLRRYRQAFACFCGRADLYVAFVERSLRLLDADGVLGLICPDRFTRNRYGRKLRSLIASEYAVRAVLDLSRASPFEPAVTCYPGIFIIARGESRSVDYVRLPEASPAGGRSSTGGWPARPETMADLIRACEE